MPIQNNTINNTKINTNARDYCSRLTTANSAASILALVTGIALLALAALQICGPVGSVGFIVTIGCGTLLFGGGLGTLIYIAIKHCKRPNTSPTDATPVQHNPLPQSEPIQQNPLSKSESPKTHKSNNPIFQIDPAILRGACAASIAFKNYDTAALKKAQQHIETTGIPLHVCPKRPEKNYPLNQDKANAYIQALPKEHQTVATKAIEHAQYISMEKFDAALKQCVQELNQKLTTPFSVGMTCGKSTQWVAGLALKDLKSLPHSWFPLSSEQGTFFVKTPKSQLEVGHIQEETLVLFDDCSFSGTQLTRNLVQIEEALKKENLRKKILVVIPFMTQPALEKVNRLSANTDSALSIEVITTSERIKTIKEIFTDEERYQFGIIFNSHYFSSFHTHLNLPGTTTFCWSDWRLPDPLSFEKGFGSTLMQKPDPNNADNMITIGNDEYFVPHEIPRPYALIV